MKVNRFLFVASVVLLVASCKLPEDGKVKAIIPINTVGEYFSKNHSCYFEIYSHENGGFNVLSIRLDKQTPLMEVADITGVIWDSPNKLIYSVSPIYGFPGIFIFDCSDKQSRTIVKAINTDQAYPEGADYFELLQLEDNKLLYYYAKDIDEVDFRTFRSDSKINSITIER